MDDHVKKPLLSSSGGGNKDSGNVSVIENVGDSSIPGSSTLLCCMSLCRSYLRKFGGEPIPRFHPILMSLKPVAWLEVTYYEPTFDDPFCRNYLLFGSVTSVLCPGEKEYYERQFAILRSFEEVKSLDSPDVIDENQCGNQHDQHERAMKISNWANVLLLKHETPGISVGYWGVYSGLSVPACAHTCNRDG